MGCHLIPRYSHVILNSGYPVLTAVFFIQFRRFAGDPRHFLLERLVLRWGCFHNVLILRGKKTSESTRQAQRFSNVMRRPRIKRINCSKLRSRWGSKAQGTNVQRYDIYNFSIFLMMKFLKFIFCNWTSAWATFKRIFFFSASTLL